MSATIKLTIPLQSIKEQLLNAFNQAQLTALKHQYGHNQIQRVWKTLNNAQKQQIQALCASETSIKQQLLASSSKVQLTAIKQQYGDSQIQRVWKTLNNAQKQQIQALCTENKTQVSPAPQIPIDNLSNPQMINPQLWTSYLEGEDFEDKALQLAHLLQKSEAYLVSKMLQQNYKRLENEQISISLRKKPKSSDYSLILK